MFGRLVDFNAFKMIVEFFFRLAFAEAFAKIFQMILGVVSFAIVQFIFECSLFIAPMRIVDSFLGGMDFVKRFGWRRPPKKPPDDFYNSIL